MRIAKLTISYAHGTKVNNPQDVGLKFQPAKTADGRVIRGLGTHYESEAEMVLVKERDAEANRVRAIFRKSFVLSSVDGIFVIPGPGAGERLLKSLNIRPDVFCRVQEFALLTDGPVSMGELSEWENKVKNQIATVPLGRGKEADVAGLASLLTLANCPILSPTTAKAIKELVAAQRMDRIDRLELKRALEDLSVSIDPGALAVEPQRAVEQVQAAPVEEEVIIEPQRSLPMFDLGPNS